MISLDFSITPDLKRSIKTNFDADTELYYQGQARLLDLIKRSDNPINLRFQLTSRYSRSYSASFSRSFHNDLQRSSSSMKILNNSECNKATSSLKDVTENNPQQSSQDCLSDETMESGTGMDEDCSSISERVTINPVETQFIQASQISLQSPDIHSQHLQIGYEKSSAESLTAFSQTVGGRDLPLRVETVDSSSSHITFRSPEDECYTRPISTLTDIPAEFKATQLSKHIDTRTFLARVKLNVPKVAPTTQQQSSRSIYHLFTLRWINYLRLLPKHHRWKVVLIGGLTVSQMIPYRMKKYQCSLLYTPIEYQFASSDYSRRPISNI